MNAGKLWVVVAVLGLSACALAAEQAAPPAAAPMVTENQLFGGIGYTFWADYGWRGINMTKVIGGHRGAGASQVVYSLGTTCEQLGKVGISLEQVYFNRFDDTGASLAFTNWNVYVTREIEGMSGLWTLGYGNHFWENAKGHVVGTDPLLSINGQTRSQEFYVTYAWPDACMWQTITGRETGNILNPSLTYLVDTDIADGGSLAILSFNHPYNMADVDPELTGITVVPTFSVTFDHRYYASYFNSLTRSDEFCDTTKIGYFDYGLKAMTDLTEMVGLTSGKLGLTGSVGYLDGVELADAKWYGGIGMTYNF